MMDTFRKSVEFQPICITPNVGGDRYFSERSVTEVFAPPACLMQNIAHGRVTGEYGRPPELDTLTGVALLKRQLAVDIENVGFKIIDMSFQIRLNNGARYVYPQATIEYCGPMGADLMLNIDQVVFVPRMLVDNGGTIHAVSRIITWDAVLQS